MKKTKFLFPLLMAIVMMAMSPMKSWAQDPTAKAVLDNGTLTFYYDNVEHDGTTYALNTDNNYPEWYSNRANITSVVFDESFASARPTSCYSWFYRCSNLTSITGLTNLNTSESTNMTSMFGGCTNLTSLDLSSFNTANVTKMNNMFYECSGLTSLNLSSFNTDNVTYMYAMFYECTNLTSLDLSSFNTANVTSMGEMFRSCKKLTSLDLRSFNTANVTSMAEMFDGCSQLTSLDLSTFNTANVTSMNYMFDGCSLLTSLDLSTFNTANVTRMDYMFKDCRKLTSLDLSSFNTANVTRMDFMFYTCSGLTSLNLSSFNTANVTNMSGMFYSCSKLKSLDLSSFNTANVTNMNNIFYSSGLTSLTIGNFDMSKVTSSANMLNNSYLKTLTLKSVPFLKDGTFNTKFTGDGVTVNYELDDNSVIYTGENNLPAATSAPTYTRNIAATSDWGTLVLPFEAKSDANVQLYTLTAASGENLTFTPAETVAANTPCVFKKKVADATSVVFTANTDAAPTAAAITATAAVDGLSMNGTYTALSNQTGMYFIAQNKFWLAEDAITIAPFRAWFEGNLGAGAKTLNIVVNDEADGIASINVANDMLNGKYLENGRVVIVKNGKKFNLNGMEIK